MEQISTEITQIGMLRQLRAEHVRALSAAPCRISDVRARTVILSRGEQADRSLLVLDGMMGRYIPHQDGRGRQMVALQVAGDFVDLHALPLEKLDHDVETITPVRLASFDHGDLRALLRGNTEMALDLWALTLIDAAINRHWTFRMGGMRALTRVANLICEIGTRLSLAGQGGEDRFDFPLIQSDLANACGMTPVHVNRILRDLREGGCCTVRDASVIIHDRDKLDAVAAFDPMFLFLRRGAPECG